MVEDCDIQKSRKWLEDLSKSSIGQELEVLSLGGLEVIHAQKGFFICNFIVPNHLSDQDGNWHVGAMATLIDDVGACTIYSTGPVKASVDVCVSYYTTEEVELEAKVGAQRERLVCVAVKATRKENGELAALGKQWMVSNC